MKAISTFIMCLTLFSTTSFAGVSPETAKLIYTKLLKNVEAVNSGDSVVEKSAAVTCFEKGSKAPFKYSCTFH